MKINDPNLAPLGSPGTAKTQEAKAPAPGTRTATSLNSAPASNDGVHLSELVRSLRSLAADSPERQERIEQLARSYANGTYKVDAHATASKIIDDAVKS
jgi:flagellar biosynthesis anti-sigma factor FlgM